MDKQHFEQLIKGIREMKRHVAGKVVRGARVTEMTEPDIRGIREAAKISQTQFAKLIGVNVRTLQNWEQNRTRPAGPARALLKIVASNPKAAIEALHAYSIKTDPKLPVATVCNWAFQLNTLIQDLDNSH